VKKGILLLCLPMVQVCPLLLLMLGTGNASIEAVQAACANAATTSSSSTEKVFGIGTFNWRGASTRVLNIVTKVGASGASIIGFQEFEAAQAHAFETATHGNWAIVDGKAHGTPATANAIAYQPGAWRVDEIRYVSIKHGGTTVQLPLVRFTSTSGLGSLWLLNAHNPATSASGSDAMRDDAVRAEANALRQLQATEPNTPLFLTGDMSDKTRFKRLFLSLAPDWTSANPGDDETAWIMGSEAVAFSGTLVDHSTNDAAHNDTAHNDIDHPFVHTTVQLTGPASGRTGANAGLGVMPTDITATPGGPVTGHVLMASANIKTDAGFGPGVHALATASPDFITLNEVEGISLSHLRSAVPGYDAYREKLPAGEDPSQAMGSAIMWRSDTWKMLDGGRVKIVEDDHVVFKGKNKLWDRFATWGTFQRFDGAVVSVIAVHHMTNAYQLPRQWGDQTMTRAEQYGLGMDYLIDLADVLAPYGPVLVGGDMNSHPHDGPNAAAPRMAAAGYRYTNDSGVIYNFYAEPVQVVKTWEISKAAVHSDHPALFTRMAMNGAGPGPTTTTSTQPVAAPAGCPPCPALGNLSAVLLTNVASADNLSGAKVAAAAAYQAGFRGEDLVTSVAIAGVESTWNQKASNGTHFGLWQIAASHKGKVPGWNTQADIFDPLVNARYAFALYSARPGSGEANFADWIPFEKTDYHQYLDLARQAAAIAAGADVTTDVSTVADTGCAASPITVAGDLSAELSARVDAMMHTSNGLCGLSWTTGAPCTYDNQCPKVVDALYGGPGLGRGYGNGQDVAQGIIDAGLAQSHGTGLDPLPPVGAVVSYNHGDGIGHVAIYVGGGKIFGNDYGCSANGVYGCVGFADVHTSGGSVTWALPKPEFDLGGSPAAAS